MSIEKPLYLVAHNIRSLFNVGSFFRTADVFGVDKVYLTGYTGIPPREQISKVALGAQQWIAWESKKDIMALIEELKNTGVKIVALETAKTATKLPKFKPSYPMALVVGNEVEGLSPEILQAADEIVEIPMAGKKESLNVAVAAGVALYSITKTA